MAAGPDRTPQLLRRPASVTELPEFDDGWMTEGGARAPFISYVDANPSVNWSAELESLHEEASRTHFLDRWTRQSMLAGLGPMPERPTIADIGCSSGFLLSDLDTAYPRATLVGVDLISSGLEKAHGLVPAARLLHADACDLPIDDASVDAIVSANLLEHVPDDRAALREFARVLRPGGRAVIVVPAGPSTYDYYDRFLGHERRYGRHEMSDKCVEAGLDPLRDGYIASLLYPAFWLVKQRNRRTFGHLQGDALVQQVSGDMERTNNSRVGWLTWQLERLLVRCGVQLPFGVRSLVVARR